MKKKYTINYNLLVKEEQWMNGKNTILKVRIPVIVFSLHLIPFGSSVQLKINLNV